MQFYDVLMKVDRKIIGFQVQRLIWGGETEEIN